MDFCFLKKNGADFVTDEGEIIKNKELTRPSYQPRSFAFCSDTLYDAKNIKILKNTNLLMHESTFAADKMARAHETFHSTASEAASIAKKAKVDKLILTHFSSRYKNPDIFYKEASEIFKDTIIAEDGLKIDITLDHKFVIQELENNQNEPF